MLIQNTGWRESGNFGRAAAIAWLLFVIILIIGLVNLALTRGIAGSDGKRARAIRGAKR